MWFGCADPSDLKVVSGLIWSYAGTAGVSRVDCSPSSINQVCSDGSFDKSGAQRNDNVKAVWSVTQVQIAFKHTG